jgi:hypothetical protein
MMTFFTTGGFAGLDGAADTACPPWLSVSPTLSVAISRAAQRFDLNIVLLSFFQIHFVMFIVQARDEENVNSM